MPRKAKEKIEENIEIVAQKKETKSSGRKTTASKSTTKATAKKTTTKKATSKKPTTAKTTAEKPTSKSTSSKVAKTAKGNTKKSTISKETKTKKSTSEIKPKRTSRKKVVATPMEYYDLPYRYNQTIVKILAQTPTILFVYWDIADSDREDFIKQYGETFFQDTKPYLVITNEDKNYQFEVEINDYANSWYLHITDSDCKYKIELIRKPIQLNNQNEIIHITSSNEINAPNDHILFDHLGKTVFFQNVKTKAVIEKDISTMSFMSRIGRIYHIYDLYQEMYRNELSGDELGQKLSSSQFSLHS